ncbi:MAG: DegT/DnrJ/EryC1/StrS aminotransferase family protein [Candidatus Omnitrophica bacterium]|nr:DegT/DnrJ/EryC1/StrS aminotransferase family protein [Candidatus Omnitrophota bacterium]
MNKKEFIPVCEPTYLGNERKYTQQAVSSGWISSAGSFIGKFEKKFSQYCGMKHGIVTTSGTSALHLALVSLGIKPGDEVIIPDFTMVAVLFAVLYCQARPVFVDVEADTYNIDPEKIEEKITAKTKAIIVVHTYGHPADMEPILKIADKHNLYLLEDAAEAHGAKYKGKKCGGMGQINCFSFFANKIITTGEGGAVVTSNARLADRCRYYKNLCFSLTRERNYCHRDLGYNYRMTNVQAALGLAQLENIEKLVAMRRENARAYNHLLKDIPGIQLPIEKENTRNVYWMYAILLHPKKFGISRNELMLKLKEKRIDTRYFFRPLHNQRVLSKFGIKDKSIYPVTQRLSENGLYLPSSSKLKKENIVYICQTIKNLHKKTNP